MLDSIGKKELRTSTSNGFGTKIEIKKLSCLKQFNSKPVCDVPLGVPVFVEQWPTHTP
mgnify:CR=1 FL=1